jgi:hypothetical protein
MYRNKFTFNPYLINIYYRIHVSVDIATAYEVDGRGLKDTFLLRSVQTGFGAHPTSYPMGTDSSFAQG